MDPNFIFMFIQYCDYYRYVKTIGKLTFCFSGELSNAVEKKQTEKKEENFDENKYIFAFLVTNYEKYRSYRIIFTSEYK